MTALYKMFLAAKSTKRILFCAFCAFLWLIPRLQLAPLLVAAGVMAQTNGEPPDAPHADIKNQLIQARLYLPDAERGYYRATRFDWSGIVASLDRKSTRLNSSHRCISYAV